MTDLQETECFGPSVAASGPKEHRDHSAVMVHPARRVEVRLWEDRAGGLVPKEGWRPSLSLEHHLGLLRTTPAWGSAWEEVGNTTTLPVPPERTHKLGSWLQSRPCSLGLASGWGARVLGWHSLTSTGAESRLQDWPSGLRWLREPLGTHAGRDSALDIPVFPTCSDPS